MSRRRTWKWSLPFVAVAVAVGLLHVRNHYQERSVPGLEPASAPWAKFSRCLLGAKVEQRELPSARYRAIERAVPASADENEWPKRCDVYFEQFDEAVRTARPGDGSGEALASWSRLRSAQLSYGGTGGERSTTRAAATDALFREASELVPGFGGDITQVPLPPKGLDVPTTLPSICFGGKVSSVDVVAGRSLRLRCSSHNALCVLGDDADRSLGAARCAYLPDRIKLAMRTSPGARLVDRISAPGQDLGYVAVAEHETESGIYTLPDGARVMTLGKNLSGVSVLEGGLAAALEWSVDDASGVHRLVRLGRMGEETREIKLTRMKDGWKNSARLVAEHLFWSKPHAGGSMLMVRTMGPEGLGEDTEVGQMAGIRLEDLVACRTSEAFFLFVPNPGSLAIRSKAGWTITSASNVAGTLSCHGTTAVFTDVKDSLIHQFYCTSEKCTSDSVIASWADAAPLTAAIDLGGRTLFVWVKDGVRMRLARLHDLSTSPNVWLVDNRSVDKLEVFARGDAAVVLVAGDRHPWGAVRVGSDGTATTVRVEQGLLRVATGARSAPE
jgi:hypothetical protein